MASRILGLAAPRALLAASAALLLLGAGGAIAQDRCEGTLCDLYYDHLATPQQKQPAAAVQPRPQTPPAQSDGLLGRLFGGSAPQQQTTDAPPAKRPLVAVQGGGVIGMMQGNAPSRCTGTLCDLFYGGPPPEEPAKPIPSATPAADDEPAVEATPKQGRHVRTAAPPDEQPSCATSAHDPWHCYR